MRVPDFAGNGEYEINNSPEAQMGNARTHFRNEVSSKKPSRAKHGHRVACHRTPTRRSIRDDRFARCRGGKVMHTALCSQLNKQPINLSFRK